MAIKEITYDNKVDLQLWGNVPDVNKIKADDMNEIKNIVNNNAKELILNEDNQIHIETEQSSTINVQDCSNLSAKIDVFGVSEQETRSGKNKFDIDSFKDISFVLNGTGEITDDYINVIATEENITYTNNALQNVDSILPEQYRKYCSELVEGENVFSFKFENKSTNKLASVYYNLLNENYKAINQIYRLADDTNVSGKLSVTINNSNAKYLYPRFDACVGGNVVYSEIMVAQDLTEYEKYGASPSPKFPSEIENVVGDIDITVCNNNLFNSKMISNGSIITVNDDYSITLQNNSNISGYVNTGKKLKETCKGLKQGETIFLKLITTFKSKYIYLIGANVTFNDGESKVLTEEMLESNIAIYGGYQSTDTLQIQISLNKLEEYTQHQSQTIIFPLQEGQKLYEGSYLAGDGIHHKRKQIELDGTEDWVLSGSIANNQYILNIPDIKMIGENSKGNLISSHFKEITGVEGYQNNNINGISGWSIKQIRISLDINIVNRNVTEFKNLLAQQKQAGTPVIVEYETEEEIVELYTEEQQKVYNQLQNITPYELVTNVFTDKAKLQFNYIADTKTYIDNKVTNMQKQLNTINELLSTANTSAMLLDNLQTDLESEVL